MKKIIFTFFAMCMMVLPVMTNAAEDYTKVNLEDYDTMNLIETLESESIEVKLENYKETDDQVTIYLFRGSGCAYCRAFLTFLNELDAEYYNKIKVVAFDAWYDEASSILLGEISSFLGEEAGGVPYIIIGDAVFPGYASDYDEGIKAAIDAEYAKEEKYNVFDEYNDYIDELIAEERQEKLMPVVYNGIITVICAVAVIFYVSYSNSRLLYALQGETTHTHNHDEEEVAEPIVVDNKKTENHTHVKKTNNKNTKHTNKKMNK